jgi:anaerobic sulfite reductase subunit B
MTELPTAYRVADRRRETQDTWTLRLEPEADALSAFAPGQFAMLYAFGAGEAPISIAAIDGGALVHTIRAVGAVTRALCTTEPGGRVGVRGPFGTRWPLTEAEGRDVVIVAGGIGLPPLRPVIRALRERGHDRVNVLYGGRSPAELVYRDELEALGARVIVDTAPEGWAGRVGVVTRLIPDARFEPANTVAMLCGPEVMMRFAVAELRGRGVAPERIWVSLERSMKCGQGWCGHCQLGPLFLCKDGPVLRHDVVEPLLKVAEL